MCEFKINELVFEKTDLEIIKKIFNTRIFSQQVYHPEMKKLGVNIKGLKSSIGRPYNFENLDNTDLIRIDNKIKFQEWVSLFKEDGWENDYYDAQEIITKGVNEIFNRTTLDGGLWNLSRDKLETENGKLIDLHFIYTYYETFIEIDRKNKVIRTFDFGYD